MKILFHLVAVFSFASAFSQSDLQSPCAASAEGKAGNITISYTIGEMTLVDSWKYGNLMITQGILQPVNERASTDLDFFTADEIKLSPNPTPGILNVQFNSLSPGKLLVYMYDITGKLLNAEEFQYTGFNTRQFDMMKYASATYLLRVIFQPANGKQKQGSFRIVKISQ